MAAFANNFASSSLKGVIAVSVIAYAVHTVSWIVHEIQGGVWLRWLEITYLIALAVWLAGFAIVFVMRRRLRRSPPRTVIGDERTAQLFMRAHQVALVTVGLAQIPFFYLAVPVQVLAQVTVTTAVIALFASFAWLDR